MSSQAVPQSIYEWQAAVIDSMGIDSTKVTSATIIMTGDSLPRVIVEYVADDVGLPTFTKQYRLTEVEVT